jgi:hypothetical protein
MVKDRRGYHVKPPVLIEVDGLLFTQDNPNSAICSRPGSWEPRKLALAVPSRRVMKDNESVLTKEVARILAPVPGEPFTMAWTFEGTKQVNVTGTGTQACDLLGNACDPTKHNSVSVGMLPIRVP